MTATIDDLRALGYTVGLAHGSVQVEQDALDAAKAAADPLLIQEQANTVVADTVAALTKIGRVPDDESERLQMFAQMGEQAFQVLTNASTERVAFHESALAIAQESPDVWHVEQRVDDEHVAVGMYVSCKADGSGWDDDAQELLDALADKDAFAERDYQARNQEAMSIASSLAAHGVTATRPTPGADTWEVEGRTFTAADLPGFLEEVEKRPPTPTTAEKVATAIAAAPEISAATKKALAAALEP